MSLYDTVAAVSTPRGKGGVAMIRISGSDAIAVASRMFVPKFGKKYGGRLENAPLRTAVFGTILGAEDQPIDEGVATLYRGPASFTGEDMAEISCHGGLAVTEAVYLSALAHGASAAGRGDFTRRAFLNGKLSLTEAEAVGQLIDADTAERMALAGNAVRGTVSREIGRISDSLMEVMTALYAAIDYPEEDVGDEGERRIADTLRRARDDVAKLLSTYKTGKAVADGVRCTVCGRPNVGKSSLFNVMTGEDSAIVTGIAGTTRDILRETVSFGGVTLRLSDTAGIRESDDVVERLGVDRAEREIESAELILAIFDGSEPMTAEDAALLNTLAPLPQPKIAVVNKADLPNAWEADSLTGFDAVVSLSAKTGDGAEKLAKAVAACFGSDQIDLGHDAVIWDVRQREMLAHSHRALTSASDAMETGDPIDAVCTLAEEALAALNETDGRGVDETIVNEIFKRFCVGK